ncbi:MAG: cupin domain-containing protein [Acidobacteriaceae bacterium]
MAKVRGEFPWYSHQDEDERLLVLRGCLRIGRVAEDGGSIDMRPAGILHGSARRFATTPQLARRRGSQETWIALIEAVATVHAGNEETPLTRTIEEQLRSSDLSAVKRF